MSFSSSAKIGMKNLVKRGRGSSLFVAQQQQLKSKMNFIHASSVFGGKTAGPNARLLGAASFKRFHTLANQLNAAAGATETNGKPKHDMFCFQCEQTQNNTGCTTVGVCGKTSEVATMQDLLVYMLKGLAQYMHRARELGAVLPGVDAFVLKAFFATLTNVNFDPAAIQQYIKQTAEYTQQAKTVYENACKAAGTKPDVLPTYVPANMESVDALHEEGRKFGIEERQEKFGKTIAGLQELIMYGLKGLCAYAEHAEVLGKTDENVFAFVEESLNFLASNPTDPSQLLGMALRVGEQNFRVMELLEAANTGSYGHPVPTQVNTSPVAGKCILVSGHDLKDLECILQQTEGKGINVYTHGEMLPAHGYPSLKRHKHLVGNYGGAWQMQKFEFSKFPGPIVMTSNCIIEPRTAYKDRIYTRGVVGWPGVHHIYNQDFTTVVNKALECEGFTQKDVKEPKHITVGFGKNTILSVADKVVGAIQNGDIKKFFVIGGCDGSEGERNYFKKLALSLPNDAVVLTLGCGKYRFNTLDFGTAGGSGIPRLLDMGQCNDAYGAIQVALALSKALDTPVNSLPLNFAVSWFEQKAVAVLLTLLHLNIQNIHLGPALPAFVTPDALKILVDNYKIKPIGDPIKDFQL